jgi:crossover junction endodeoxyribonuclease RusA
VTRIEFAVRGLPQAQGSARAFVAGGRAIIATNANRPRTPLGAWRTAIATEARDAIAEAPLLEGPLTVRVAFVMPRPRSHYLPANSRRPLPVLRLDAPSWDTRKPDVDKLQRALFDALTNVVWRDDAQVTEVRALKLFEASELYPWAAHPGAFVVVRTLG